MINPKMSMAAGVCAAMLVVLAPAGARAASDSLPRIEPAELVKQLSAKHRPLLFQVGFHVLYAQAHIPGSKYVGPASTPEGIEQLKAAVKSLPSKTPIVLYCGCCPWAKCPNLEPAYQALLALHFTQVKVLRLEKNFGADWVDKGYPVEHG